MGNKYLKKVQDLKERKKAHDKDRKYHGSTIDIRNIADIRTIFL